jgi:hypothetical protein
MTWIALGTVWALIRYRRIGASAAPDQHPTRTAEITTLA